MSNLYLIRRSDPEAQPEYAVLTEELAIECVERMNAERESYEDAFEYVTVPVVQAVEDVAKRYVYRAFVNAEGKLRGSGEVAFQVRLPSEPAAGSSVGGRGGTVGFSTRSYEEAVEQARALYSRLNS